MKTQSERWFEDFCTSRGIVCHKIPEENCKTPDYQLNIDGQIIIVEVKEFLRNSKEEESDRLLDKQGYGLVQQNTPGDHVRKKITDSYAQIKAGTKGKYPGILVLCDIKYGCGQIIGHADPYNIRVGMYGLEQKHVFVPQNPNVRPYTTGVYYGPKRKMTKGQNTAISAIGVLWTSENEDIQLDLYHNIYAAHPVDPALIAKYGIRQFRIIKQEDGTAVQWQEILI